MLIHYPPAPVKLWLVCGLWLGSRRFPQPARGDHICCGLTYSCGVFVWVSAGPGADLCGSPPHPFTQELLHYQNLELGLRFGVKQGENQRLNQTLLSPRQREGKRKSSALPPSKSSRAVLEQIWKELRKEEDSEIPAESSPQEGKHRGDLERRHSEFLLESNLSNMSVLFSLSPYLMDKSGIFCWRSNVFFV